MHELIRAADLGLQFAIIAMGALGVAGTGLFVSDRIVRTNSPEEA